MSKYGLKFERKEEACVELLKTHHIYLENDKRSFQRSDRHYNILIEGENYQALKILSYTHAGKVDVIYIDPPYNTGNKDFVYNDSFVDSEDDFRHSKWLSFMEKRLKLAHELMSERGVIFISIDDNEQASLKLLCDDVFGHQNFIANMIWQKKKQPGNDSKYIAVVHEYVLVYTKNKEQVLLNKEEQGEEQDASYKLEDEYVASRGKYKTVQLDNGCIRYSDSLDYRIDSPDETPIYPGGNQKQGNGVWTWRWSVDKVKWGIENGFIVFKKASNKWKVYYKQYQYVNNKDEKIERLNVYKSLLLDCPADNSDLKDAFDGDVPFSYAKPVALIKQLLSIGSQKDSIILDFFAGSGTTGQATAELNLEDHGTRQFILVTNNDKSDKLPKGICEQVTFPRLEKTIGNENLKVFKIATSKKKEGFVNQIAQLEVGDILVPILCLAHNTFTQIEKDKHSIVFANHAQDTHLGIYSCFNSKQAPINATELRKFSAYMTALPNFTLAVNRPRRGYACEYVQFMKH